jgi:DNA-binding transcriptional LysR family regulator
MIAALREEVVASGLGVGFGDLDVDRWCARAERKNAVHKRPARKERAVPPRSVQEHPLSSGSPVCALRERSWWPQVVNAARLNRIPDDETDGLLASALAAVLRGGGWGWSPDYAAGLPGGRACLRALRLWMSEPAQPTASKATPSPWTSVIELIAARMKWDVGEDTRVWHTDGLLAHIEQESRRIPLTPRKRVRHVTPPNEGEPH